MAWRGSARFIARLFFVLRVLLFCWTNYELPPTANTSRSIAPNQDKAAAEALERAVSTAKSCGLYSSSQSDSGEGA